MARNRDRPVLIVADNDAIARVLALVLMLRGYETAAARIGSALRSLDYSMFCAVVIASFDSERCHAARRMIRVAKPDMPIVEALKDCIGFRTSYAEEVAGELDQLVERRE